jgi:hypothetical protein
MSYPATTVKWVQATPQVEGRYAEQHVLALANLQKIKVALENLPAPEGHVTINWGHVGSLAELNKQLEQALEFIESV